MSSLGGRRRERGKTLLSPGSGPRIIREPAVDRLTADRLAGVLSLLSSGQPEVTESKFAESKFAESEDAEFAESEDAEFAESEVAESEVAKPEWAKPQWAKPQWAEPEWAQAESVIAGSAQVPSPPEDLMPELGARENSVPEFAAREALLPELAVSEHSVPAAAVPAVGGPGRHRRPGKKGRATKNAPRGMRTVGLVVRRLTAMSLVTLVAIAVGLGVLKVWG